ncbi:MAG: EAL domain-containing protein [Alphaproteobacteria bacterium]|nr:EAL domain-containing protein [Alphaproteobacteria bacterium]
MTNRLLVIDDETDICELIADVAETRGFDVKTISDPRAVEQALLDFKPRSIILDLMMPGTDGVELLRNLGDAIRGCGIVLMSGHDLRVLNSAKRLGAAHGINVISVLAKPINITELRETLDTLATLEAKAESKQTDVSSSKIKVEEIAVFYQPILDLETNRIRGMEALVRWNHPEHGILAPDLFLERMDAAAMDELADRVMTIATDDLAKLHEKGFPLAVSINLTASNLIDLAVPDRLDDICKQKNIPNEKITIEVTESEAMRDVRRIMDVLTRLRLRGFGVAIDDFGVGYSSLRELQRMPFNSMKMDKSFVMDMGENRDSQMIANTIIDLGHNLKLKVVAEGIETVSALKLLKDRGCDLGQGYLISKPVPYEKFLAWITENAGVFKV